MRFRNHHAGCCGFNPTHPDGTEWHHVFALHDGSVVHADTAAEIVEELIAGYAELDAARRRAARVRFADKIAADAQEARIEAAVAGGLLDPADDDQQALLDILRTDKSASLALEDEDVPGAPAPWLPLPELVLVTTSYAPHTTFAPLTGNVLWIDPDTDESLLASLGAVGVFNYWSDAA